MAANKIKFGIEEVHYAPRTESTQTAGVYTYGAPVAIPGAVNLTLDPESAENIFYADDREYYRAVANNGYSGDLEIAILTDAFRVYALGETIDSNGVLVENGEAEGGEFALGFKIKGNDHDVFFWFYNCVASRPSVNASTKEDTITPQTDTISIAIRQDENKKVRSKTTSTASTSTINSWFTSVYKPTTV